MSVVSWLTVKTVPGSPQIEVIPGTKIADGENMASVTRSGGVIVLNVNGAEIKMPLELAAAVALEIGNLARGELG